MFSNWKLISVLLSFLLLFWVNLSISEELSGQYLNDLYEKGVKSFEEKNYEEAKKWVKIYLDKLLEDQNESESNFKKGHAQFILGVSLRFKKEYKEAKESLKKSLHTDFVNDPKNRGMVLMELGYIDVLTGNYKDAIKNLEEAHKFYEQSSEKSGKKRLYTHIFLGMAYENKGDLEKSYQEYDKALSLAKSNVQDREICIASAHLGTLAEKIGAYSEAESFFLNGLPLCKKVAQEGKRDWDKTLFPLVARKVWNINFKKCKEGAKEECDFQKMEEELLSYLKDFETYDFKYGIGYTYLNLGDLSLMKGEDSFYENKEELFKIAKNYYQKALEAFSTIKYRNGEGYAKLGLGRANFYLKDFKNALSLYQETIDEFEKEEKENFEILWQGYLYKGELFINCNKQEEGKSSFKKGIEIIEKMHSYLTEYSDKMVFFRNRYKPYEEMVKALISEGNFSEALIYAEMSKNRLIQDLMKGSITNLEDEKEEEKDLEQKEEPISENKSSFREKEGKGTKINLKFKLSKFFSPPNIEEIQRMILGKIIILYYVVYDNVVFLALLDGANISFIKLPISGKDLTKLVNSYLSKILEGEKKLGEETSYLSDSHKLYDILIKPVYNLIKKTKRICIIPSKVLNILPFTTLLNSEDKFLIEEFEIFYTFTANTYVEIEKNKKSYGKKVLAILNPDGTLPGTLEEGKVFKMYDYITSILSEKYATKENILKTNGEFDIFHLAGHYFYNSEVPDSSYFILANNEKLNLVDLLNLNFTTNIAILSACETGLGQVFNIDELVGVTQVFFLKGASSVIASLWKVKDTLSTTPELMRGFYYFNLLYKDPIKSFIQSQRAMIETGRAPNYILPKRDHPYYWAPFVVFGS